MTLLISWPRYKDVISSLSHDIWSVALAKEKKTSLKIYNPPDTSTIWQIKNVILNIF